MVQFLEDENGNRKSIYSVEEMGEAFYYMHFWRLLIGLIVAGYPYYVLFQFGKILWGDTGGWICAIIGLIIAIGGLVCKKWWILGIIYLGTLVPFIGMVKGWFEE